jgi:signal transduction histidine kinase/CheY-like chemotaxis protein
MSKSNPGFDLRRDVSPRPAIVCITILGLLTTVAADRLADANAQSQVRQFAVLLYGLSVAAWLLDRWKSLAGRWFTVLAATTIVVLGRTWLDTPGFLFLYPLPVCLAASLVGLPAAACVGVVQSALLVSLPRISSLELEPITIAFALAAVWTTLGAVVSVLLPVRRVGSWSWAYYQRAQGVFDEVRERRAEQAQTLSDLADANLQLIRLNNLAQGLRQLAEQARRAKEQFVSNVSHELRTPLNMIIGFTEMILEAPGSYGAGIPPALLADMEVIRRNSEHLSSLIDDVLDLSQIDVGQMALVREHVQIVEVIDAAVVAVRPLFESKGLFLDVEPTGDLPRVFCDRTRIREVVLNLLSNAGRFTERGGVCVRACQEEGGIVVEVSDTGRGIPAREMEKLFQPFQQLGASVPSRFGGSGLGLSISKRFVELHGGRIWVESAEGVGTTFSFRLPIAPPAPVTSRPSRWLNPDWEYHQRTRPSKAPLAPARRRLLVLESGVALQRLLGRYLATAQIIPVGTLDEAAEDLATTPAEALLINEVSVAEALRALAECGPLPAATPVIVCSVPGIHEAARELDVAEYLVKPVHREDLLDALDRLNLAGRTVLIVDDKPDAVRLFRRMVAAGRDGYTCLRASNGLEALSILREQPVDAVLLDLVMPKMDGFRFLEAKEEDPAIRDIPVVIISARDPAGQPIVSNSLTIARGEGLSMHHVLSCVDAVTGILSPTGQRDGRAWRAAVAG